MTFDRRRCLAFLLPFAFALASVACGDSGEPGVGPDASLDWPVSTLVAEGMNPDILEGALIHIRNDLPNMRSFLIVRNGKMVFEEYFGGSHRGFLEDTRSVTKSLTATNDTAEAPLLCSSRRTCLASPREF